MSISISYEKIEATLLSRLKGNYHKLLDIPSPNLLKDAQKAATRITQAIQNQENITVVGDYDVDGVISTTVMIDFFKLINYPLTAIIPNRFKDGYGLSSTVINKISTHIIISVDNGINANIAADVCKQKGIDLIITDHHKPSLTLPNAFAIVNPKQIDCSYPLKEICGAQVAWLLLALVKKNLNINIDMGSFLDLLAIAIIADVMPLVGINHIMVKVGLQKIIKAYRPSMIALCSFLNKDRLTAEDISFQVAPRINAAGRMDDAIYALNFLTANSSREAFESLQKLDHLNSYRKSVQADIITQAIGMVNLNDSILVVASKNWHEGVVGIVAAHLVNEFSKPAIVLVITKDLAKGSARSIGDVDLHQLITLSSDYLIQYGGHKMAAGLSLKIENLNAFKKEINQHASKLDSSLFVPKNKIFGELYRKDINFDLFNMIAKFEPFGEGNLRPKFLMKNIKINFIRRLGKDKKTLLFCIDAPQYVDEIKAIAFKNSDILNENQVISFSYTLNKNEFKNRVCIQLVVDKIYL